MNGNHSSISADRHKLFVCSDWHLGGNPDRGSEIGSQICRSTIALTTFIDWVASEVRKFDGTTELVINGDMVDFLAPSDWATPIEWISDQEKVITLLDRIIANSRDDKGRGPFEALVDFLSLDRAALTLLLGNHDVELSLPLVRQYLESTLGSKLRIIYDGEPLVRGRVLIEHGNRYDPWNDVDHSRLRQERSHVARGLTVDESQRDKRFFRAPAGTYLVVHGINSILQKYPFINLLKPENEAAVPLLLALEPQMHSIIGQVLSISPVVALRRFQGRLLDAVSPAEAGRMTGAGGVSTEIRTVAQVLTSLGVDNALFPLPVQVAPMGGGGSTNRSMALWQRSREVAASIAAHLDMAALATEAVDALKFRRLEVVFQSLKGNRTFDHSVESPNYLEAAKSMVATGRFDVIIFGHTHLPKQIDIPREGANHAVYLNTGTWADVMRLPDKVCESSDEGRAARRDFLTEVAAHRIHQYLFTSLGYAEIELAGGSPVTCHLRSFTDANPRSPALSSYR